MTEHRFWRWRGLGPALLSAWMAAGCVVPNSTGAGGSSGAGGAGGTGGGGVLSGSDIDVCSQACQTIIGCGADLDIGACKTDCVDPARATLVKCLRQVTASCNPVAECFWAQVCNGSAPVGSASCEAVQQCAESCAGTSQPSCACQCAAQADASVAASLYNLVAVCVTINCGNECDVVQGNPGSCQSCMANLCATTDAKCN